MNASVYFFCACDKDMKIIKSCMKDNRWVAMDETIRKLTKLARHTKCSVL